MIGPPGRPAIRRASIAELPSLREIERAAGEPFRSLGMDAVADDEPPSLTALGEYQRDGRAFVAVLGEPVGYLLVDVVDGAGHVEQVSVHPSCAGRGIGRDLIGEADRWAAARRLPALTLTTFRDVPWNAPYYERLGFRRLAETELTAGLHRVRRREAEHGLDRWPRVVMRRESVAP